MDANMFNKTSCLLLALVFSAGLNHAVYASSEEDFLNNEENLDLSPNQLQSIPLLQSLKNLNTATEYQAPYVHELKNRYGVRSLFVESQDLPMVDIQLTFNAGAARDTEIANGLGGLASMTARLMSEGTEKYNATQIASVFEQTGARFSIQAYRDMFVVHLRVLSDPKKREPALNMLLEILNNATFKNNSLSLAVSNNQAGQQQLKENPSRLMGIQFYRSVYGTHPYAEPITGTNGSIKRINPERLKQFRDKFLVAQNMNIAITGKLDTKEAQKLAEYISSHVPQGTKAGELAQPLITDKFVIKHIPFQSTQAHITFGHIGTTRNDPDRLALEVANRMFGGGGFNSILMQELRVKRGYTYGAYSSFSFSQAPGVFSFSYSTRQDQLMDSIKVAHKAFAGFIRQPIDRKQLEDTKAGMLRAYPNNYSSNASINAQLGLLGFYGQPADYLSQYPKLLASLTVKDIENALRKHLHADNMTIVIVSPTLDQDELQGILDENLTSTASDNTRIKPKS